MVAIMEISVLPVGTGNPSISEHVAECVKVVAGREMKYQVAPMGTVVEGEVSQLLRLAEEMHRVPFERGALRVVTSIKLDDRKDKTLKMEEKTAAVRRRISDMQRK